ncbi:MAG: hypothetical protein IJ268_11265, partial [Proteobacteria bacterium]|nr:hypothetical protein [Pseudomonadota bacterium]
HKKKKKKINLSLPKKSKNLDHLKSGVHAVMKRFWGIGGRRQAVIRGAKRMCPAGWEGAGVLSVSEIAAPASRIARRAIGARGTRMAARTERPDRLRVVVQ